jgi:hypothetical protein
MSIDELVAEALRLSREERARIAEELLSSSRRPTTKWSLPGQMNFCAVR